MVVVPRRIRGMGSSLVQGAGAGLTRSYDAAVVPREACVGLPSSGEVARLAPASSPFFGRRHNDRAAELLLRSIPELCARRRLGFGRWIEETQLHGQLVSLIRLLGYLMRRCSL